MINEEKKRIKEKGYTLLGVVIFPLNSSSVGIHRLA
jgi:hypothetical protein